MLRRQSIAAKNVLQSDLFVRGLGVRRALSQLEQMEPDLAEYVMETSTRLYEDLGRVCGSPRRAKLLHRRAIRLALTCIHAVRRSA